MNERPLAAATRRPNDPASMSPERRRRARLLSAVLLVVIPAVLALIAVAALTGTTDTGSVLLTFGGLVVVILLFTAYRLASTPHYGLAAALALVTLTAVPLVHVALTAFQAPDHADLALMWLLLPVLLSSVLLNVRGTAIFVVGLGASIFALPWLGAPLPIHTLLTPLALIAATAAMVVAVAAIRNEDARAIEAQRAEARNSEQRFRNLFDGVSVAFCVHEGGVIQDVNLAFERLFGYGAPEGKGMRVSELIAEAGREAADEALAQGDEFHTLRTEGRRKDGSTFPVDVSGNARAYRGHDARVLELRDVTALREARGLLERATKEAEQASRSQARFLAYVGRALRPPVQSAHRIVGTLVANRAGNLRQEDLQFLHRLSEQHESLLRQIDDILLLSQVESGRLETARVTTFMERTVQEVVDELRPQTRRRSLGVEVELPPIVAPVFGDPIRLKQALKYLLGHAVRATRKGAVRVALEADDESRIPHVLHVSDSGTGLSSEERDRIFAPLDEALASSTGELGLVICRSLLELMGFTLEVQSELGQGTTFTVRMDGLQLAHQARSPEPEAPDAEGGHEAALPLAGKVIAVVLPEGDPARKPTLEVIEAGRAAALRTSSGALMEADPLPEVVVGRFESVHDGTADWGPLGRLRANEATREVPYVALYAATDGRLAVMGRLDLAHLPLEGARLAGVLAHNGAAPPARVLLVHGDEDAGVQAVAALREQGYDCRYAPDGGTALDLVRAAPFDAFVVDPLIHVRGGLELLEHVRGERRHRHLPLVVLYDVDDIGAVLTRLEMVAESVAQPPERFLPDLTATLSALLER